MPRDEEVHMTRADRVDLRLATHADARAVAALHADSWRRHYRGAYSDAYLDGEVEAERLKVWHTRLELQDGSTTTVLAEEAGTVVGFIHVVLEEDPTYGSLVDNLHVAYGRKRGGIGTRLITEAAKVVIDHGPGGLHLWVLEQNSGAQRFYEALGGQRVDRARVSAPSGNPERLQGSPIKVRYVWPHPAELVTYDSCSGRLQDGIVRARVTQAHAH
jgi:GNAT superfamily N-acetyltransferase